MGFWADAVSELLFLDKDELCLALARIERGMNRWERTRLVVFERDGRMCRYCFADGATHVDHVIPRSRGGSDTFKNLRSACWKCNLAKGNRTRKEWGGDPEFEAEWARSHEEAA